MIHNILRAVLLLFHRDPEEQKEFEDWVNCKQVRCKCGGDTTWVFTYTMQRFLPTL